MPYRPNQLGRAKYEDSGKGWFGEVCAPNQFVILFEMDKRNRPALGAIRLERDDNHLA
jgi:hypothetical protein